MREIVHFLLTVYFCLQVFFIGHILYSSCRIQRCIEIDGRMHYFTGTDINGGKRERDRARARAALRASSSRMW